MAPNANGAYKVGEHIRKLWEDGATRDEVKAMFAQCDHDVDWGLKTCSMSCVHVACFIRIFAQLET